MFKLEVCWYWWLVIIFCIVALTMVVANWVEFSGQMCEQMEETTKKAMKAINGETPERR